MYEEIHVVELMYLVPNAFATSLAPVPKPKPNAPSTPNARMYSYFVCKFKVFPTMDKVGERVGLKDGTDIFFYFSFNRQQK